jgi:dUTPase
MQVDIKRVTDKFIEVPLPYYATENSAGMDIHATIEEEIII